MCKKKIKKITCVAYLSTQGNIENIESCEKRQLEYMRKYARAHNIEIVKVVRRNIMGQRDVNKHFLAMVSMIKEKKVEGILLVNMSMISNNISEAYYKVGQVKEVNGEIITVDTGRLDMNIKGKRYEVN